MRKYWKLITTLLVIVLSIGTFYIRTVIASDLPQFVIKSEVGTTKEIDSLVVTGQYVKDYNEERVWIDGKGSDYWSKSSVIEQVNGQYHSLNIKKLQKQFWNFTRGKGECPECYYNGQQFLAYANITYDRSYTAYNKYLFNISVLNKKTDQKHSFHLKIPNERSYSSVSVHGVFIIDEFLKVITHHDRSKDPWSEYHIYTFDIEGEKLIEGEVIQSYANDQNIDLLKEYSLKPDNNYLILRRNDSRDVIIPEEVKFKGEDVLIGKEQTSQQELIVYDLQSRLLETYVTPVHDSDIALLANDSVYFLSTNRNDLEVSVYDIEEKKVTYSFNISLQTLRKGDEFLARINNGHLYVVTPHAMNDLSQGIYKIDLESGDLLYSGRVESITIGETTNLLLKDIQFK